MTLAGIELRYLVNYISEKTGGYYVSNIYGIDRDSLLFKLHHPEKEDILLMVSSYGLWISSVRIEQAETNKLLKRLRSDLLRLKLSLLFPFDPTFYLYLSYIYLLIYLLPYTLQKPKHLGHETFNLPGLRFTLGVSFFLLYLLPIFFPHQAPSSRRWSSLL